MTWRATLVAVALFATAASAASAPTLTAEDTRCVDRAETVVHERRTGVSVRPRVSPECR